MSILNMSAKDTSANTNDETKEVAALKKIHKTINIDFPKSFIEAQTLRIQQVKIQMMLEFPFFGYLLLNLPHEISHVIPTMATDGLRLYINPLFLDSLFVSTNFHSRNINGMVKKLEKDDVKLKANVERYLDEHAKSRLDREDFFKTEGFFYTLFILYHEIQHCIRDHCGRGINSRQGHRCLRVKDKNGGLVSLWNLAGDYVINGGIVSDIKSMEKTTSSNKRVSDFIKKPKFGLFNDEYTNKTTEEVYDILLKKLQDNGKGKSDGDSDLADLGIDDGDLFDEHDGLPNTDKDGNVKDQRGNIVDKEGMGRKWEDLFTGAYYSAKEQGMVPSSVQSVFDILFAPPQIPWYEELAKYIFNMQNGDEINLRRPNKRYQDFFIPTHKSENINVIWAMDTSGSMFEPEVFRLAANEIQGIFESFDNVKMRIISCDCTIQNNQLWEGESLADDVAKIAEVFKGGGGTSFVPVFDLIQEEDDNSQDSSYNIVIYFTDGYGEFPSNPPDIDVIWIRRENDLSPDDFPFGKVITIN